MFHTNIISITIFLVRTFLTSVFIIIFFGLSIGKAQIIPPQTAETIGTITEMEGPKGHQHSYTKISYEVDNAQYILKIDYDLFDAYNKFDKMSVKYKINDPTKAVALIYKPYFYPSSLPDTTEGTIVSVKDSSYCELYFKAYYNPSDSFDVTILKRKRYLSKKMFDTLHIKKDYVYKIIYDQKYLPLPIGEIHYYNTSEILFSEVIDSTHTTLNKHLYHALYKKNRGEPIEAIADLTICIQLDSINPYYYIQRARCFDDVLKNEKAVEDYTTYIQLGGNESKGKLRRSIANIRRKQYDNALSDLAILDSTNDEVNYYTGAAYYGKENYPKAIDYYNKALLYSTRTNNAIYYYDLALAKEKLAGKNSIKPDDFTNAEAEAIKNHKAKIHGKNPHTDKLSNTRHSIYLTFTSDNYLPHYTALHSNMKAEIMFPYTTNQSSTGNKQTQMYDQSVLLNKSNKTIPVTIGTLSMEIGGFKKMYGRIETGYNFFSGQGTTGIIRAVAGHNIEFPNIGFIIFRPEIGFTYLNRRTNFPEITIQKDSSVSIKNINFNYSQAVGINVTLRENVLSASPSLSLWLFPYSSRLVVRINAGYNCTLFQNNSIYFQDGNHLRQSLSASNSSFTNTNGRSKQFFNYNGLFVGISLGVRFGLR